MSTFCRMPPLAANTRRTILTTAPTQHPTTSCCTTHTASPSTSARTHPVKPPPPPLLQLVARKIIPCRPKAITYLIKPIALRRRTSILRNRQAREQSSKNGALGTCSHWIASNPSRLISKSLPSARPIIDRQTPNTGSTSSKTGHRHGLQYPRPFSLSCPIITRPEPPWKPCSPSAPPPGDAARPPPPSALPWSGGACPTCDRARSCSPAPV